MANSRKTYEMLFQLNAQLGGSYNSTFTKAQAEINSMQKEIQELSSIQKDISAYQKQQSALEATQQKLANLQAQYDNIQKEIDETGEFSSDLENKLLAKKLQIEKTTAAAEKQKAGLDSLSTSLKNAGVNTDNLAGESQRLGTQIGDLKRKQEQAAEGARDMGDSGVDAVLDYQQALAASGIMEQLQKLYEGVMQCAEASVEFESAIAGVYKTVDGTDEELAAISDEVKALATEIPAATGEIAAVAEAAGQLGIATGDVMEFTAVMIDLGESTNLSSQEAASSLAKFANITGTAAANYSRLGSVIVDLGNNFATTEADIVAMSTRLASAGTLAGLTEAEIMALSAAMSSVGIEAEAGGTAMTQTLSAIEAAVVSGGDTLEEFARIAGMSAEEFAYSWETSPISAIQAFISGIGSLEDQGESAVLVLDELGLSGVRQSNMLKSLGLAADTLAGAVNTANTAWEENVALTEEASKRYATTESQQAMMENAFNNLKVAVGDNYTPALRELYSVGTDVLSGMTEFVEENPGVVKGITAAVGVIGVATAGITGYTAAVKLAQTATALFSTTIPGIGTVVAVTAAVAGLAGVVGALSEVEETETETVRKLTEASREDYYQLQEVKAEYEEAAQLYGENSDQAQQLAWQVEYLTGKYEDGKQSVADYAEEMAAANESAAQLLEANREAYAQIGTEETRTLALVNRLRELASQTEQTVETQEEMKAIIAQLNEVVPELALSYEDVVSGTADYAAAVEAAVKAEAAQQRYEANQQYMVDALNEKYAAQQRLSDAMEQQATAQERLMAAEKAYNDYITQNSGNSDYIFDADFQALKDEYDAATEAVGAYAEAVAGSQEAVAAAEAEYQSYLSEQVDYVEAITEQAEKTDDLNGYIEATVETVQELAAAYTEAYDAAYESVSGTYALWEQTAERVSTDADVIAAGISSQVEYWQAYNENLQSLTERSGEIEGLAEMLASFADGSADSVNAVAGMAEASDRDLAAMVESWQVLREEQENVANSIAQLNTSFGEEMDALMQTLEADVEAMNFGVEAAESGQETIRGFIDGATEMLPQVQEVFGQIAQAALSSIATVVPDIVKEDNRTTGSEDLSALPGYAVGTLNAKRGFAVVGENGPEIVWFDGGEQVTAARETAALQEHMQVVSFAPQAISALYDSGGRAVEAQSAASGSSTSIEVVFQISGNATPETVEALDLYGAEFAERVRTVVEEANADAARRRY